jgi:CubicO group peptidase (beta-lactamase class C family)
VTTHLSRRTVLQGAAASSVVAAWPAAAAAAPTGSDTDWGAFDHAVRTGFDRMKGVGAAIAVVSADRVLHTLLLGSRSLQPRQPVTADTRFVLASMTKSMTAGLVATYVDDGTLSWDQPVVDAWSGFSAPNAELTRTLRVRDVLGMATGLRDPAPTDLHMPARTAADVVRSVATLPVNDPPGQAFFYGNTLYALGGYLGPLAQGASLEDLGAAFPLAVRDRIFRPAGMTGAWVAADPRGLVDDYATGYGLDLMPRMTALAFPPMAGYSPSGGALGRLSDVAAWVRLQLREGRSVNGNQVVSAANLAETWKAGISAPVTPASDPDAIAQHYAMGWFREQYRDGTTLVQHGGYLDGFTPQISFLPEHDLGLVVLTNCDVELRMLVLNVLLSQRLHLNVGVPEKVLALTDTAVATLSDLGRQAQKVDRKVVEPYLGRYERGYSLERVGSDLLLRLLQRDWPLEVMPDGTYVVTEGILRGVTVRLAREADGVPHIEIAGMETVRRTTV